MLLSSLIGAGIVSGVACGPASDELCEFSGTCGAAITKEDASDATTDVSSDVPSTTDGGAEADAPGDVYIPPDGGPCTLTEDPHDTGCKPLDGTGLFVNAGAAAGGTGTQGKPFQKISDAVATLSSGEPNKPGRIYVCAGEYTETVTIDSGLVEDVKIFGGLSCANWAWTSGAAVHVKPSGGGYALHVMNATKKIEISDVGFESPAAAGYESNGAGKSSIAGFVSQSTDVTLRRVVLKAGAGVAGKTGDATADWSGAAPTGNLGTAGAGGGDQPATPFICPSGTTQGGRGGNLSGSGADGFPGTLPVFPAGHDGARSSATECANSNVAGHDGSYGPGGKTTGSAGSGASAAGTLAGPGWLAANGGPGGPGTAAQGGGGGGGGTAGGGGGGGQGGCGGSGGNAGTGAGASIALLAYSSPVKLANCTLSAAAGAAGGAGGKGQNGQEGGFHGNAGGNGCQGGNGGIGGSGGGGGGGAGGVSVGIGYFGAAPIVDGTTVTNATTQPGVTSGIAGAGGAAGPPGAAGAGSPAGLVGDPGTKGSDGIAGAVIALPGT